MGFVGLTQGIINNFLNANTILVVFEFAMVLFFALCIYLLRRSKDYYDLVINLIAFVVLVFFNALILYSNLENIKFIWLFFYVVTFMFLKGNRIGLYWILGLLSSLLLVQFQPFVPTYLTMPQTLYLIFVLVIIASVTYFFQKMIDRGYRVILKQNKILSDQVSKIKAQEQMLIDQSRFAAMGEMIQMIAHQWRQPLANTTLMISNHQIQNMLSQDKQIDATKLLEDISTTITYLSDTIDDFQSYFKPTANLTRLNVKEAIQSSAEFIAPRLRHHGVHFELTCKDDLWAHANTNALIQVLLNLLNNAIDALKEQTNRRRTLHVKVTEDHDSIEICVEDNAGGIPAENVSKLFEPYFSTKGKNGTGLGLYMVKMIVEKQFEGNVEMRNVTGGSQFIIRLERSDGII
jgi:signal transduction histidine kinase